MAWTRDEFLRALRAVKRRLRFTPRTGEPIAIQRDYFRRLNIMRNDMITVVREFIVPRLEEIAANASRVATTDAVEDEEDVPSIGAAFDAAERKFDDAWPRSRMGQIVEPIAREIPRFNARNLNMTLSRQLGQTAALDIVGGEAWVAGAVAEFTAENVALIKSIPSVFFSDLEKFLTRSIADGARWEDLAAIIEDRYDVTESRARLIARDQVNKFVGDMNRVRQGDLGIVEFVWTSMGDERVRTDATEGAGEGHAERNGRTYRWDAPPNGETPGEPINCRCYGAAVLPDVEDDEG